MTAPILHPLLRFAPGQALKNWAGNLVYSTSNLYTPAEAAEIPALLKKMKKVKVLGTRHCFNDIADSRYNFISLRLLNRVDPVNEKDMTVSFEAGISYGQLSPRLDESGFALHNLASLPHISVAGAITTATHGSGEKNGNLSSAVRGMEFILANGETLQLSRERDGAGFAAAVVGLGGIGVLGKITLAVEPTFQVRQDVYEQLPMNVLASHFDEIQAAGYSVSLFTDWQSDSINEVWLKNKVTGSFTPPDAFFGSKPATKNLHPIAAVPAENCTAQMGVPGKWYERLPHFKMGFTPSSGVELQSEYFVPREHAVAAIQAIARMGHLIGPQLMISEIRTIAADDLMMSPCNGQDCITIHFTWKQHWPEVKLLLPQIEQALKPFDARPHWGKLFTMSPADLAGRYKHLQEFRTMLRHYDPEGKFRNDFLSKYIFNNA